MQSVNQVKLTTTHLYSVILPDSNARVCSTQIDTDSLGSHIVFLCEGGKVEKVSMRDMCGQNWWCKKEVGKYKTSQVMAKGKVKTHI
jgi:hypothetical protein